MSEAGEFLGNFENFYSNLENFEASETLSASDLELYKVETITYKEDAPRKEALENVLGSLRIEGINFVYLVLGNDKGVEFYYGVCRDLSAGEPKFDIDEIGRKILEPSIRGNFRGSCVTRVKRIQKEKILNLLGSQKHYATVEGCAGVMSEQKGGESGVEFQGVDRLVDVMCGDEFGFGVVSSLVSDAEFCEVRQNVFAVYDEFAKFAKKSKQSQDSFSDGTNESTTEGTNESTTKGKNKSEAVSESGSESRTKGKNEGSSTSDTDGTSDGTSWTNGSNETTTKGTSQGTTSGSSSNNTNNGSNESKATGKNTSTGTNRGTSKSHTFSTSNGTNSSETKGTTKGTSTTEGTNSSTTKGSNESSTKGKSSNTSHSSGVTFDEVSKLAQDWMKFIDEVLLARLDYGSAKGFFRSAMFCFSSSKVVLTKLQNMVVSLFGGEVGNKVPLRAFELKNQNVQKSLANLQLARTRRNGTDERFKAVLSQSKFGMGNLISSKELSLVAGLPQNEVVGLSLAEQVEFGLNCKSVEKENRLTLGTLVQSGNETNMEFCLDKKVLDKHIFVTGVTGSGKTTTCQRILQEANLPFMVIEPAKTEYRILRQDYPELLVFTLGNDSVAPFRLNPFEFFPNENITSRVDMIKASIEAAFDMEAAIPQLIESAIYAAYEKKGWNVNTNKNSKFEDPFADGVYAFPTLSDLMVEVENVVNEQGFDERLKRDYLGSIRARLNGLLVGSKGLMLNVKRSVDFRKLLDKKVVFELEEIRNGGEKSLVMGFLLGNLLEAIKDDFKRREKKHDLRHITLIEEAHRLLSKYENGDNRNKKQAVECFADMLAEIRKYGECLMVADQIPNKLIGDVLKNTNTKVVHRLFAKDDKEAVSNVMALEDEQAAFLGKLGVGRAVVFCGGFSKAVCVQVKPFADTTSDEALVNEANLREAAMAFYASEAERGVVFGAQFLAGTSGCGGFDDSDERGGGVSAADVEALMEEHKRGEIFENLKFVAGKFESGVSAGVLNGSSVSGGSGGSVSGGFGGSVSGDFGSSAGGSAGGLAGGGVNSVSAKVEAVRRFGERFGVAVLALHMAEILPNVRGKFDFSVEFCRAFCARSFDEELLKHLWEKFFDKRKRELV